MEKQVYDSFIKEKGPLLNYINAMVKYAAQCQQIDITSFMTAEEVNKSSTKIENMNTCNLTMHRVMGIVSSKISWPLSFFLDGFKSSHIF